MFEFSTDRPLAVASRIDAQTGVPVTEDRIESGADRFIVSLIAGPPLLHEGVRELLKGSVFDVVPDARFIGGDVALIDPSVVDATAGLSRAVGALSRRFRHVVLFPMVVTFDDRRRVDRVGASGAISQLARGFELRHGLDSVLAGHTTIVPSNPNILNNRPRPAE